MRELKQDWKSRIRRQEDRLRRAKAYGHNGFRLVFIRDEWPWKYRVERGLPEHVGLISQCRPCDREQWRSQIGKAKAGGYCSCEYGVIPAASDYWSSAILSLEDLEKLELPS